MYKLELIKSNPGLKPIDLTKFMFEILTVGTTWMLPYTVYSILPCTTHDISDERYQMWFCTANDIQLSVLLIFVYVMGYLNDILIGPIY
jgi:hypothetical protein